ncbi:MAG TPA: hypothetical protein IGS37_00050 [Synechococcales cyanobacterium M55_K2018_004]|nr:hypothetical protein [Synechococcales cyanobacterium M55_K2018_004]
METTSHQHWLQHLEQRLQARSPRSSQVQIRCGVRQGNLVVVGQHAPDVMPDPQETIEQLVQQVRQEQDKIRWETLKRADARQVMIVLRIMGESKPYRMHTLSLRPKPAASSARGLATVGAGLTATASGDTGGACDTGGAIALAAPSAPTGEEAELSLSKQWVDAFLSDSQAYAEQHQAAQAALVPAWMKPWRSRLSSPAGMVAMAAAVTLLAGGLYMLTRPCVIGGCQPLETAQAEAQTALQTIQKPQSAQQVVDAYGQLVEANYLLSTIPSWSSYYPQAQGLMQSYEGQAAILEKVVKAQRSAYAAAVKSQNPPHPLPTWREVQQLWQGAIAELEQVPADSPIHSLAQAKQAEYQQNLTVINRFISAEQQAQERVRLAREAASVAEARGGAANSLETWKDTQATWQRAVQLLQQVPQNTMAYGEAQQLLALYQPRLVAATTRLQQEEVANSAYTEAVDLATKAQQSERENQWTTAVGQWRTALTRIQQVPSGTSRYPQAQPLVTTYRNALSRAQQRLGTAVGIQSARIALEQTCGTTPRICTYASAGNAVQVRLTPSYTEAAGVAIAKSPSAANPGENSAMLAYMNPLLQALASVGEQANLPIELYNADGSLFGTYAPQLDGYVPLRADDLTATGSVRPPTSP